MGTTGYKKFRRGPDATRQFDTPVPEIRCLFFCSDTESASGILNGDENNSDSSMKTSLTGNIFNFIHGQLLQSINKNEQIEESLRAFRLNANY